MSITPEHRAAYKRMNWLYTKGSDTEDSVDWKLVSELFPEELLTAPVEIPTEPGWYLVPLRSVSLAIELTAKGKWMDHSVGMQLSQPWLDERTEFIPLVRKPEPITIEDIRPIFDDWNAALYTTDETIERINKLANREN